MRRRGFSLIELMIVVAIVALLATVAYPSYLQQVRKARRVAGKTLLLRAANREERYYSTASPNTYTTDMTALGFARDPTPSGDTGKPADAWYLVSVATPTKDCPIASCYVLQAQPRADQSKDGACASLRIDSLGRRSVTGTAGVARCW